MSCCAHNAELLRPPPPRWRGTGHVLQRKCACGGTPGPTGECEACRKKRESGFAPKDSTPPANFSLTESRFDHDFSRTKIHSDTLPDGLAPLIQRQLSVGGTDDPLEREADRVADQVTSARSVRPGAGSPLRIQRVANTPAHGGEAVPPSVNRVLAMPGRLLETSFRRNMEQQFGHDFSRVKVHDGSAAGESARDVNALAYTVGPNIVFREGRFAPGTTSGRRLIAHELTHVVQQSSAAPKAVRARNGPPITPRAAGGRLQRKAGGPPADQCESVSIPKDPCAEWSTGPQLKRLSPFVAKSRDNDFGSRALNTVSAVMGASLTPVDRARLLRIACCQLGAKDAAAVLESFSARRGTGGQRFGEFATATRCELLAILRQRAATKPVEPNVAEAIRADFAPGSGVRRTAGAADTAFRASARFNLYDPAVLKLAADTVKEVAGEEVMVKYLMLVDQTLRARPPVPAPDPAELLKVKRRGPYGTYFGVALPVVTGPLEFLANFIENVKAFIGGLRTGVSESVSEEDALAFGKRLAGSVVMGIVFPLPFLAGTAAGLWAMVKGLVETIVNIREVVESLVELFKTMFSRDGYPFAKAMGRGMGVEFGKTIVSMSKMSLVGFAYELGKLIGPAILMFVLTVLGIPGAAFAAFSARLAEILGPVLQKFPRFARLMGKVRKAGKVESKVASAAKVERGLAKEATVAEVMELAASKKAATEAVNFVEHHPKVIRGKPGHREAPAGKHTVVEIDDPSLPSGIGCEVHSPKPYVRVPCPAGMGTRETVEQFQARGGKIEKIDPKPNPKSESEMVKPRDPQLPQRYADMPYDELQTRKQAGVSLAEDHHTASKYVKKNKELFKRLGINIDSELNLIRDFGEHGQLRGWYDWNKGGYKKFHMKGHHKKYNQWVTRLLTEAAPPGLAPDVALQRVTTVLERLSVIVRNNPELLTHGPGISPKFAKLKDLWK